MNRWLEEFERQLRPEARIGLAAAVVVLTILGGHLYLLEPAWAEHQSLEDSRRVIALQPTDADAHAEAEIDTLRSRLSRFRQQLYGGSEGLAPEQMESFVIEQLDRIALDHGVQLASVTPGPASNLLSFDEVPYDVRVVGRYFDLFAWLTAVEDRLRPLAVKSYSMKSDPGSPRVRMELRLVSYRAREGRA